MCLSSMAIGAVLFKWWIKVDRINVGIHHLSLIFAIEMEEGAEVSLRGRFGHGIGIQWWKKTEVICDA